MLSLHGPTSFQWANDKGGSRTVLANFFPVLALYHFRPPRYDGPPSGSEGETHRHGQIFAGGWKVRPKPSDEEGRVDPVAHGGQQEAEHQDDRDARHVRGWCQRCVSIKIYGMTFRFAFSHVWYMPYYAHCTCQHGFTLIRVSGSGWTPLHGAVMEKDKESVNSNLR